MALKRANYDYLKIFKEIPLLFFISLIKKHPVENTGNILIINSCLIGDFTAFLPALSCFIKKNKMNVDLMTSPQLKQLAEKIKGVRKVFVNKSIYNRPIEGDKNQTQIINESYDKIIVIRAGKEAFNIIKNIRAGKISTSFISLINYSFHLLKKNIRGELPKQWAEINFEILGEKIKEVKFKDIFNFTKKDYEIIKDLKLMKTKEKKVIIHTGASWIMNKWDNRRWIELLKRINLLGNFKFVFVGLKKDFKDYKIISKKLNFKTYSLIDKMSIKDLMLLLRASDYFIGVDSGPANMAHLADIRSITLFGPGPHMFMPTNKKDIIIDKSNGKGLYQRFFYKKKGFIQKIDVDEVYTAFKILVNKR